MSQYKMSHVTNLIEELVQKHLSRAYVQKSMIYEAEVDGEIYLFLSLGGNLKIDNFENIYALEPFRRIQSIYLTYEFSYRRDRRPGLGHYSQCFILRTQPISSFYSIKLFLKYSIWYNLQVLE